MKNLSLAKLGFALAALLALAACRRAPDGLWQGYVEGEYIYVASPLAGRLETLAVPKGTRIDAGAPLFTLEREAELAVQREAAERLRQTEARLADLTKGQRPTELAALEARLAQAHAAAELATRGLARLSRLHETSVLAEDEFDRARLAHETAKQQVAEIEAQLATAHLGARDDAIAAAEAEVAAARAALDRAAWNVAQKSPVAPVAALVHDTLYREGEFVTAGLPIVSLLPPENVKVRFFVPESDFAALKLGDVVRVSLTKREPFTARIIYLSTRAEYTPPVLYNRENRAKLVFMVEAVPVDAAIARDLHPGQPADVSRE